MRPVSKEMNKLEQQYVIECFDGSPVSKMDRYQALAQREDRLRRRFCDGLDDKKVELLEQLLEVRDRMEFERDLYYLWRGILLGAEGIEITKDPGIFT